ncbi:MAG TPA: DUF3858 domain-containing protein, partial [Planctomycetota bacterium]|nr:DUF3858 domain-containing protein [Planctomycetota bacterium]
PWFRELAETTGQYERFVKDQAAKRFNGATVQSWKTSDPHDQGAMWMETELKIPTLTTQSGDRKSVPATYEPLWLSQRYATETRRTHALELYFTWQRKSRVQIALDEGLKVASLPENVELNEPFGKFTRKTTQEGQGIVVEELFELTQQRIPVADYDSFRRFCNKVDSLIDQKILLEAK